MVGQAGRQHVNISVRINRQLCQQTANIQNVMVLATPAVVTAPQVVGIRFVNSAMTSFVSDRNPTIKGLDAVLQ